MKLEFDATCPNCKRTFKQRVEDMRPGNSRSCPNCGATIKFTGDDGRKAQQALDDLERTLSQGIDIKL
jgi:rRNA maturation endonuclease Nob1